LQNFTKNNLCKVSRLRDRDRNPSRPRPETFETETPKNESRDTSRDRVSRLHHWLKVKGLFSADPSGNADLNVLLVTARWSDTFTSTKVSLYSNFDKVEKMSIGLDLD